MDDVGTILAHNVHESLRYARIPWNLQVGQPLPQQRHAVYFSTMGSELQHRVPVLFEQSTLRFDNDAFSATDFIEIMDLEDLQGVSAAPQPSATMAGNPFSLGLDCYR